MTKILIEIDTDTQRVVPVEPTEEMAWIAARHYESDEYTGVRSTYKAMLAAAPQPEPVDVDLRRDAGRLAELVIRMDESRRLKDYQLMHIELNEALEIAKALS